MTNYGSLIVEEEMARQKELEEERIMEQEREEHLRHEEELEQEMADQRKRMLEVQIKLELERLRKEVRVACRIIGRYSCKYFGLQEEEWKIKVAKEEAARKERQRKKDEMKKQIAEEIERIRKMEELAAKQKAEEKAKKQEVFKKHFFQNEEICSNILFRQKR